MLTLILVRLMQPENMLSSATLRAIKILEEWGGIYFDTDVEAVAPIDDMLKLGAFMGLEDAQPPTVSSGLVMAVEAHHPITQEMLDFYDAQAKDDSTAMLDTGIVVSG